MLQEDSSLYLFVVDGQVMLHGAVTDDLAFFDEFMARARAIVQANEVARLKARVAELEAKVQEKPREPATTLEVARDLPEPVPDPPAVPEPAREYAEGSKWNGKALGEWSGQAEGQWDGQPLGTLGAV